MIVIDVETSGIDSQKSALLSLGAVDFSDPTRTFYEECSLFEGAVVLDQALAVNGFLTNEIAPGKKQSLRELVKKFLLWAEQCEDKTLAGHNPSFDRDFLMASIRRTGFVWTFAYRTIDLHTLCYAHYFSRGLLPPRSKGKTAVVSNTVFVYVGLPREPDPHHGLMGAKMEAEAFSRLLLGKGLLEEFSIYKLPDYLLKMQIS